MQKMVDGDLIGTIIVKDLSRFGREQVEMGRRWRRFARTHSISNFLHKAKHGAAPFQRLHRILPKNFVIHPYLMHHAFFCWNHSAEVSAGSVDSSVAGSVAAGVLPVSFSSTVTIKASWLLPEMV